MVLAWATLSMIGLMSAAPADPEAARLEQIVGTLTAHERLDDATRLTIGRELLALEKEHGVDPLLVLAVIERESRFDPQARGIHGALGLMQVRPIAAREVAGAATHDERSIFDPATNVRLGVAYLAQLRTSFGDWALALTAYNMGPTRLRGLLAAGQTPAFRYAAAILTRYQELAGGSPALPPGSGAGTR